MHHGAKNSACRNTPPVNCATLKTSDSASILLVYREIDVSVMSAGGAIIDLQSPLSYWLPASADRFVHAVGATAKGDRT